MQLKLQFQTAKKCGQLMSKYLLKIKKIANNLFAIGEFVTEQDQILNILGGLGHEYNSFVVSITSSTNALNLDDINNLLLAYESCLEQQTSTEEIFLIQENMANVQNNFSQKNQE